MHAYASNGVHVNGKQVLTVWYTVVSWGGRGTDGHETHVPLKFSLSPLSFGLTLSQWQYQTQINYVQLLSGLILGDYRQS